MLKRRRTSDVPGLTAVTTPPKPKQFLTESRINNRVVLELGNYLEKTCEASRNTFLSQEEQSLFKNRLSQFVLDFNLRIANDTEYAAWKRCMHRICGNGNSYQWIKTVVDGLLQQLRTFHTEEYPDLGEQSSRNVTIAGEKFKSKAALKTRIVRIIRSTELGKPLAPESQEYKLIKAVLERHPRWEAKSVGLAAIQIGMNKKAGNSDTRVIMLVKSDGTSDDISFAKCLTRIQDPVQDPIRHKICCVLFSFFVTYKKSHAKDLLACITDNKPPPEFFVDSAGRFINVEGTITGVQSYLRGWIELLQLTALQPAAKTASSDQLTQASIESLEYASIHKTLLHQVYEFLHCMETELRGVEANKDVCEDEAFAEWHRGEAEALKKRMHILKNARNAKNPKLDAERAEIMKMISMTRQQWLDLWAQMKVESDVSPIYRKLDDSFTAFIEFICNEISKKKHVVVKRSRCAVYLSHTLDSMKLGEDPGPDDDDDAGSSDFSSVISKPGKAAGSSSAGSWSSAGKSQQSGKSRQSQISQPILFPKPNQDFGILSEAGSVISRVSSHYSKRSGRREEEEGDNIRFIEILYAMHMDFFTKFVLSAYESPVLPYVYFVIVNADVQVFGPALLDQCWRVCHAADSPEKKSRILSLIVSYACRLTELTSETLETTIVNLAEMIHLRKLTTMDERENSLFRTVVSGLMEIIGSRWKSLDLHTETLIRVLCILARCYQVLGAALVTRTIPRSVGFLVRRRLVEFDFAHFQPVDDFLNQLPPTLNDEEAKDWPARNLDEVELHRFQGYVHQSNQWFNGWKEDIAEYLKVPLNSHSGGEATRPPTLKTELGKSQITTIWESLLVADGRMAKIMTLMGGPDLQEALTPKDMTQSNSTQMSKISTSLDPSTRSLKTKKKAISIEALSTQATAAESQATVATQSDRMSQTALEASLSTPQSSQATLPASQTTPKALETNDVDGSKMQSDNQSVLPSSSSSRSSSSRPSAASVASAQKTAEPAMPPSEAPDPTDNLEENVDAFKPPSDDERRSSVSSSSSSGSSSSYAGEDTFPLTDTLPVEDEGPMVEEEVAEDTLLAETTEPSAELLATLPITEIVELQEPPFVPTERVDEVHLSSRRLSLSVLNGGQHVPTHADFAVKALIEVQQKQFELQQKQFELQQKQMDGFIDMLRTVSAQPVNIQAVDTVTQLLPQIVKAVQEGLTMERVGKKRRRQYQALQTSQVTLNPEHEICPPTPLLSEEGTPKRPRLALSNLMSIMSLETTVDTSSENTPVSAEGSQVGMGEQVEEAEAQEAQSVWKEPGGTDQVESLKGTGSETHVTSDILESAAEGEEDHRSTTPFAEEATEVASPQEDATSGAAESPSEVTSLTEGDSAQTKDQQCQNSQDNIESVKPNKRRRMSDSEAPNEVEEVSKKKRRSKRAESKGPDDGEVASQPEEERKLKKRRDRSPQRFELTPSKEPASHPVTPPPYSLVRNIFRCMSWSDLLPQPAVFHAPEKAPHPPVYEPCAPDFGTFH
eukprot:Blabericola_migrator_1__1606@NODE_1427_length_4564_cov_35_299311_g948_i0_p1_GENE_NODE_1427_length_4564_cov_35_299311_g948_i0NODE_1427_length_4564_cov_35_299311_g948_i0_p1_ORF_typecomplete_len1516_score335_76DUF3223/PF11523_8/9_5e13RRN3/PF05327_11/2_4e09_NODE_1427_length_4564_cov_35_299311_g948_i054552